MTNLMMQRSLPTRQSVFYECTPKFLPKIKISPATPDSSTILYYLLFPIFLFLVKEKEKRLAFASRLSVGVTYFLASSKYCASFKSMPVACFRRKKLHPFGWSSLCWRYLSSRPVTRQVLSAKVCLTSVFGMGTGGPTPQSTPTIQGYTLKTEHRNFILQIMKADH